MTKKGIFSISADALAGLLGLPPEARIYDMRVVAGASFELDEKGYPVLEAKVEWDGLPLVVREGEIMPRYTLEAEGDLRPCGHNEVTAKFYFSDRTKSEEWRMK